MMSPITRTRPRALRRRVQASFGDVARNDARDRELTSWICALDDGSAHQARLEDLELLEWPVLGRVTSPFGDRFGRFHAGIDIKAALGARIAVAADGVVLAVTTLPDHGNTVVVGHGLGLTTLYAHADRIDVAPGDQVVRGQSIARVGMTGRSLGPHLHFETRIGGTPQDPLSFLPPPLDPAAALREVLLDSFREVFASSSAVAIVGSPLHGNAGDSMIWLGQLALLKALGQTVWAVRHPAALTDDFIRRLPSDVVIVDTGGGNVGDRWPYLHAHRERMYRLAGTRRIVQLPQSLAMREPRSLNSVRALIQRHPDVVLSWRDQQSAERAAELFPSARSLLTPDVAFAMRPLSIARTAAHPLTFIARDDCEGGELRRRCRARTTSPDWTLRRPSDVVLRQLLWLTTRADIRAGSKLDERTRRVLVNRACRITVVAAARQLSDALVVVSDRLHAHVLATHLGVPHVLVDGGYGKITSYVDTWRDLNPIGDVAASVDEALVRAHALADDGLGALDWAGATSHG
jgi:exopolysaccharide biosynthesis predicted pyruvyltransferase EpsI